MALPTDIYVDPAIAANSGSGTIGDPYGDLQYAFDTATRDTSNGNYINVKAGTAEVLTGTLSFATWGSPTSDSPTIIRGYTSVADDGGIGVIDGNNGDFTCAAFGLDYQLHNMRFYNTGTAEICTFSGRSLVIGCQFDTGATSSVGLFGALASSVTFIGCHLIGVSTSIRGLVGSMTVEGCYFTGAFEKAIDFSTQSVGAVRRSIFSLTGASVGVYSRARGHIVTNNSFLSAGGTGSGIELTSGSENGTYNSNIIEGFSGSGGCGVKVPAGGLLGAYFNNAFYNNATNESGVSTRLGMYADNEILSGSGFAKSGSDTFSNRGTYFAPLNVGAVWGGAFPSLTSLDKGAIQHTAAGGGGFYRRVPVTIGAGR